MNNLEDDKAPASGPELWSQFVVPLPAIEVAMRRVHAAMRAGHPTGQGYLPSGALTGVRGMGKSEVKVKP